MRRLLPFVFLMILVAPAFAGVHDAPLPRGSRRQSADLFTSSAGFRDTVSFYKRWLTRTGLAHEEVPIYRYRGATVARFLSRQPGSRWLAVVVFQVEGVTRIAILSRTRTPPKPGIDGARDPS